GTDGPSRPRRRRWLWLLVPVMALAGVWALVRAETAAVALMPEPAPGDELAFRRLLQQVGDPRRLEEGQLLELRLDPAMLRAVATEASRRYDDLGGTVRLAEGDAEIVVAVRSPKTWVTPFLNVRARVRGLPADPEFSGVRVGDLPLPGFLGRIVARRAEVELTRRIPALGALIPAVESLEYGEDELRVAVRWSRALSQGIRDVSRGSAAEELGGVDRISAYREALLAALVGTPENVPLARVLPPFAAELQRRVAAAGSDARAETRAAFAVLTFHAVHHPIEDITGSLEGPEIPERHLTVQGRGDLTKHFLVSALTTMVSSRLLGDALGLAKELNDADGGSGFSFADLAADRAGTRLAETAFASDARLRVLAERLASPLQDDDLVPAVGDLPEGMDLATFTALYEDASGPRYEALIALIDARLEEGDVLAKVQRAN
ncbi:MAG: hypothetical protein AAF447_16980, partial [Myxococcota bacterium]